MKRKAEAEKMSIPFRRDVRKGIILCHYGTGYSQCGSYRCQYCRCEVPQELYQPRFVLLSHISTDLIPNFILARIITVFFFCPQIITDLHRLFFCTEIRGFILNKDTAGSALIFSTALRDYSLLRKFTA